MSILNTMEGYPLAEEGRTEVNYHRLIESYKFGFAQRSLYGDPVDPVYRNISELAREFVKKEASESVRRRINDVSGCGGMFSFDQAGFVIGKIDFDPPLSRFVSHKRFHLNIMNRRLLERRIMAR